MRKPIYHNDTLLYVELPYCPRPPDWIIDQIDLTLRPDINDIGGRGHRYLENWKGFTGLANQNTLRRCSNDFGTWVSNNIIDSYQKVNVNYCWGYKDRTSTGAHTDFTRDWVLLWNVSIGGPNATLCFWQQHNQGLIRDRQTECGRFEDLVLLAEISGPSDIWYLVNANVLHSTEHVCGLRLNLQVSFEEFPAKLMTYTSVDQ